MQSSIFNPPYGAIGTYSINECQISIMDDGWVLDRDAFLLKYYFLPSILKDE